MTAQLRSPARQFFDLSARVKLRVSGADRLRFLNGQLTNDARKATETNAIEACVLNAKGKMEAHLFLRAQAESFVLDADPALQPSLKSRLERYIIADDVQIEDVTAGLSIFHVIGAFPPNSSVATRMVSINRFGPPGHDIWSESAQRDQLAAELSKDFKSCDENCAEVLRIEQGIPRWGRELTSEIIPVEANLEQRCIDYEKGCYIGQETISRMKMSGQRNKQLGGLVSLKNIPLASGMRLTAPDGKEIGWITSATRSGEREIALAYIKRGFNSIGSRLEVTSVEHPVIPAEVVYRLTRRSHDLFPVDSNQFTLELLKSVRDIYGANGPEKLLYNVFEKRTAELKAKAKADNVVERAKWLVKVRDSEGYMAQFLPSEKEGPQILECHSPIFNLLEKYPIIGRLEQDMFEAVLGSSVRREETRTSGLYQCAFYFAA